MNKTNRKLAVIISIVLVFSLFITGCSTPKVAVSIKKDGAKAANFSTGEYIAYMYEFLNSAIGDNTMYSQYPDLFWSMSQSYGEWEAPKDDPNAVDPREKLEMNEFLIRTAQDAILRRYAVLDLMNEKGFTLSEKNEESIKSSLANYGVGSAYGFNKASYETVLRSQFYEASLFSSIYGKDGTTPISESEIQKYYDENILSYKIIPISLQDAESVLLSDEEVAKIRTRLEGYQDLFETESDFDKALTKFEEDENNDVEEDADKITVSKDPRGLNLKESTNEDLTKAIQKVDVGKADIVEFMDSGTQKTLALICRIDPNKTEAYTLEELYDTLSYALKFDEFEELIKEHQKKFEISFNASVRKKCTPKTVFNDVTSAQ